MATSIQPGTPTLNTWRGAGDDSADAEVVRARISSGEPPPPPSDATQLTMVTQPSATADSGAPFAQQPSVRLLDEFGAPVTEAGVTVTASIASGGGSLLGQTVATTDENGIAEFADLAIDSATSGNRTLGFASAGLTPATSNAINLTGSGGGDFSFANVELPRVYVDTSMPDMTGATVITVAAADNLQSKLNDAAVQAASTPVFLRLENGAQWVGTFEIPSTEGGENWVIVEPQSSAHLPALTERRFRPSLHDPTGQNSPSLATTGGGASAALRSRNYVRRWRFVGIRFRTIGTAVLTGIVRLDVANPGGDPLARSEHVLFDRCWIEGRGRPLQSVARGLQCNGAHTGIINSWVEKIEHNGADSQAVGGGAGPGPHIVRNCFLEATGENIMWGGGPAQSGIHPEDIEHTFNHLYKPPHWNNNDDTWDGNSRVIKNGYEIKFGRRVLIEGNVIDGNWPPGQSGIIVNLKVGTEWLPGQSEDITFRNNLMKRAAGGLTVLRRTVAPTDPVRRLYAKDNLWLIESGSDYGSFGRALRWFGTEDAYIHHNTFVGLRAGSIQIAPDNANLNPEMLHNILSPAAWAKADGTATGTPSFDSRFTDYIIRKNLLTAENSNNYGPGSNGTIGDNFFPANEAAIGFDPDWSLSAGSAFKGAGDGGVDPGTDVAAVLAATAGVEETF